MYPGSSCDSDGRGLRAITGECPGRRRHTPDATIVDIALENGGFSTLVAALQAADVLAMEQIQMANGDYATISVRDGVAYIDDAPISNVDINTSNGVIHVIDAFILPPAH